MQYEVMAYIDGSLEINVEADSFEEAVEMVRNRNFDTSLNRMDNISIEPVSVYDESGKHTSLV